MAHVMNEVDRIARLVLANVKVQTLWVQIGPELLHHRQLHWGGVTGHVDQPRSSLKELVNADTNQPCSY